LSAFAPCRHPGGTLSPVALNYLESDTDQASTAMSTERFWPPRRDKIDTLSGPRRSCPSVLVSRHAAQPGWHLASPEASDRESAMLPDTALGPTGSRHSLEASPRVARAVTVRETLDRPADHSSFPVRQRGDPAQ